VLETKGVQFGRLRRAANGRWDGSGVAGFPAPSLASTGPGHPLSLIIRPFHQVAMVVSLREFSNKAFNPANVSGRALMRMETGLSRS
jgi:hypothetical protein